MRERKEIDMRIQCTVELSRTSVYQGAFDAAAILNSGGEDFKLRVSFFSNEKRTKAFSACPSINFGN